MTHAEAHRRDAVWRRFFAGVGWDRGEEFALTRQLVLDPPADLAEWPNLVEWEWEVIPGASNHGRGDLLFSDGSGRLAIVEVKHIDRESTGPTASSRRTKTRKQVKTQARRLALDLEARCDAEITAFEYTNEQGLVPA